MTATNSPDIGTDTALILWVEQVEALAVTPEAAEQAIASIHERMGQLHEWYSGQGDLETAKYIADTFEHAKLIYTQNQKYQVAMAAGQAAVQALAEQRAAAVNELYALTDALRTGSEAHPELKQYAESIRWDERNQLIDDEDFLEEAEINAFTVMERQIRATLHRYGLSAYQSQRLLEYIIGVFKMDEEQRKAFSAFLDTLS